MPSMLGSAKPCVGGAAITGVNSAQMWPGRACSPQQPLGSRADDVRMLGQPCSQRGQHVLALVPDEQLVAELPPQRANAALAADWLTPRRSDARVTLPSPPTRAASREVEVTVRQASALGSHRVPSPSPPVVAASRLPRLTRQRFMLARVESRPARWERAIGRQVTRAVPPSRAGRPAAIP